MNTALLAAISGSALINAIIMLIIAAVIFWLLNWLIGYIGMGEPFNKIAKVIIAVAAVILCINALLMLVGRPIFSW